MRLTAAIVVVWCAPSVLADAYPESTLEQATIETVRSLRIERLVELNAHEIQVERAWAGEMAKLCLSNLDQLPETNVASFVLEFQRHAGRTARYAGYIEQAITDYEVAIEYATALTGRFDSPKKRPDGWITVICRDIADAYLMMGAHRLAQELTTYILRQDPVGLAADRRSPAELERLATLAERERRFAEAVSLMREAALVASHNYLTVFLSEYPQYTEPAEDQSWGSLMRNPEIRTAVIQSQLAPNGARRFHCGLARYLRLSGQLDDAEHVLETADLTPWQSGGSRRERLDLWVDREWAFLALARSKPAEALERARACVEKYAMSATERVELHSLLSSALDQLGDVRGAFGELTVAIEIVETRRANLFEDDNKRSYIASYAPLYRRALELVIRIHGANSKEAIERSFEWSERIRARAMLDTLNRYGRRMARAIAIGDTEARRSLRGLAGQTVSIETLRKAPWWPKKTALLEYTYDGIGKANGARASNGVHLWIVTASSASYHRLSASADAIDRACQALTQALRQRDSKTESWGESASRLYHMLIAPVADKLSGIDRLVIVGDGALLTTPFEVLVSARNARPDRPVKHELLIDDFAISYSPSATLLNRISIAPRPKSWQRALWAFASTRFKESGGPPERSPTLQGYKKILRAARSLKLDDLRYTAAEVEEIASLFGNSGSRTFVHQPHMKNRLLVAGRQGKLRSVRFLHFATHAIADSERPYLSGLVLCPPYPRPFGMKESDSSAISTSVKQNGRASIEDMVRAKDFKTARPELLSLSELTRLDLGTELVVLSACKSLGEKAVAGDWLQGLARAFLVAGSSGVVCSAWDTSDWHTTGFMPALYESLLTADEYANVPIDVPKALQELKAALMESPTLGHPSYWAQWVYFGRVAVGTR